MLSPAGARRTYIPPSPDQCGGVSDDLFRAEVLEGRAKALEDNISIATPLPWQVISFTLLVALLATFLYLAFGSYSKVQSASGTIVLDRGVATVTPSRSGTVERLLVNEGDRVKTGDRLVFIRSDEALVGGGSTRQLTHDALTQQDQELVAKADLDSKSADAEIAKLRAQAGGTNAELANLAAQVADQNRLIEIARTDFADAQNIAKSGFISRRDIQQREALLLSRRQELSQLTQQQASKRAEIVQVERAIAAAAAQSKAQAAEAQSQRAQLREQLVQADAAGGYAIVAPVSGVVTAVLARPGQPVALEKPLLTIIPDNARVRAELYLPTAAISFVSAGQPVQLAVDAFPFDRFGTVKARVLSVSRTTITRDTAKGPTSAYLVTAEVPRPAVKAFGRWEPLRPGMTVTARIIVDRRSLIQWLFEPLFAVQSS